MGARSNLPTVGAPTVLFVPTELEATRLADLGGFPAGLALRYVCGFGAVAAAARTAQVLAEIRPARVLLIGIAGTYDEAFAPIGSALEFSSVAIDGVGVGEGAAFIPPPTLGFPQWPGSPGESRAPIFDRLSLASRRSPDALLLTTCAASIDAEHAASRKRRFPSARAEDMEGFAVALACELARVPLRIVRGISNVVGDRDSKRWRIPSALAAARALAIEILESNEPWGDA